MKSQIWIAVSVYVIIAIIRKRLHIEESLHTILQILSLTAFEKTSLKQLLSFSAQQTLTDHSDKQLNLLNCQRDTSEPSYLSLWHSRDTNERKKHVGARFAKEGSWVVTK